MAEQAHLAELRLKPIGYADDYGAWVEQQMVLLRERRFQELDVDNLVDEVADLGKSDFRKFRSAIEIVIVHMLKWDYRPRRRSQSWVLSIAEHRLRIEDELAASPSYRARREEAMATAFRTARVAAARQMKLKLAGFPINCPYDWDMIVTRPHPLPGE